MIDNSLVLISFAFVENLINAIHHLSRLQRLISYCTRIWRLHSMILIQQGLPNQSFCLPHLINTPPRTRMFGTGVSKLVNKPWGQKTEAINNTGMTEMGGGGGQTDWSKKENRDIHLSRPSVTTSWDDASSIAHPSGCSFLLPSVDTLYHHSQFIKKNIFCHFHQVTELSE